MPSKRPNILVLWGDDIGWYNISHNNRGAMGYQGWLFPAHLSPSPFGKVF